MQVLHVPLLLCTLEQRPVAGTQRQRRRRRRWPQRRRPWRRCHYLPLRFEDVTQATQQRVQRCK
jgi:hypothetical protein